MYTLHFVIGDKNMRTTHTFAELAISARAWDEIAGLLRDAGYQHAFQIEVREGRPDETIDMHGIGLTKRSEPIIEHRGDSLMITGETAQECSDLLTLKNYLNTSGLRALAERIEGKPQAATAATETFETAREAVDELFNALPEKRHGRYRGHLTELHLFIDNCAALFAQLNQQIEYMGKGGDDALQA